MDSDESFRGHCISIAGIKIRDFSAATTYLFYWLLFLSFWSWLEPSRPLRMTCRKRPILAHFGSRPLLITSIRFIATQKAHTFALMFQLGTSSILLFLAKFQIQLCHLLKAFRASVICVILHRPTFFLEILIPDGQAKDILTTVCQECE